MVLCCGDGAQHAIRDRLLCELPVLLNDVEFRTIWWKIVQAQRFATRAAKPPDGFALVPWCIIEEQHKSRMFLECGANEPDECFLCLSCNEAKEKRTLGTRADDVETFARVIRLHDGTAAFQRPPAREVGRDDDRALIQTRDRPAMIAIEAADAFRFFLKCSCAAPSAL